MSIAARRLSRATHHRPIGVAISGARLAWPTNFSLQYQLDQVVALGATWLRFDILWSTIEDTQGTYVWTPFDTVVDAARTRGLKIVGILTTMPSWARPNGETWRYGPMTSTDRARFAQFARDAALHFAGRIDAYEIWNEPNLSIFWSPQPSASNYANLLRTVYPAIRAVDSTSLVITGGLGGAADNGVDITSIDFVTQIYDAGAKDYFDALATHPYTNLDGNPSGELYRASLIRTLMNNRGDGAKLMWGTETGASTSGIGSWTTDEAGQANILDMTYRYWYEHIQSTGPLFWYTLTDFSDLSGDNEGYFGIIRSNGTFKPAYSVLRSQIHS